MPLLHRSTLKHLKKSSFAFIRFFYDLLWFSKISAKLKAIKEKHICIGDPKLSSNTDSSEQVLLGTIHMSLGFTVRPFPFLKFLLVVPLLLFLVVQRRAWPGSLGPAGGGLVAAEKGRPGCVAMRCAHTRSQHGPRRPAAYWPQK